MIRPFIYEFVAKASRANSQCNHVFPDQFFPVRHFETP